MSWDCRGRTHHCSLESGEGFKEEAGLELVGIRMSGGGIPGGRTPQILGKGMSKVETGMNVFAGGGGLPVETPEFGADSGSHR